MVRRHGWQLPAHTFQVVAIAVFFLLAISFYVFLAPFLWFHALEFMALALYSPLACAVFLLYIRSSAIDPADPGVFAHPPQSKHTAKACLPEVSMGIVRAETLRPLSPGLSSPSRSSSVVRFDYQHKASHFEQPRAGWRKERSQMLFSAICGPLCWLIVKDDSCKNDFNLPQPLAEEDVLFCTLCNAEVRKHSKHCRSCDKCVDGFDHHCRWLNNCVGKKNYNTFVSLMAVSLSLLVLEWGIGMAVLVRCFVDKKGLEHQIVDKLGDSFSRPPFATVVAICTVVSLLASIPLGELFFFHLILIRKGITTYEYVVAMRAQNDASVEGDTQSIPTSPSSSTGLSGSSSLGLQYSRGTWCTPPRVEHQDEVIPHLGPGRLPSTIDPDLGAAARRNVNHKKKGTVRISAWKLSRLNADEATRAAVKAREDSSILRQVGPRDFGVEEREHTSTSSNVSSRSSVSADDLNRKGRLRNSSSESVKVGPLPVCSSPQYESPPVQNQIRSSCNHPSHSVTDSTSLSPLPAERRYELPSPLSGLQLSASTTRTSPEPSTPVEVGSHSRNEVPSHQVTVLSHAAADFSLAWSGPAYSSDGYEASAGESADDGGVPEIDYLLLRGSNLPDESTLLANEEKRTDFTLGGSSEGHNVRTAGRDKGFNSAQSMLNSTSNSKSARPEPSALHFSFYDDVRTPKFGPDFFSPSESSSALRASSSVPNTPFTLDSLVCSGTSIFYGGPFAEPPSPLKVQIQDQPNHPNEPRMNLVKPVAHFNNKPHPTVALRLQSPVFAPRAMF
ncbi:unnamed protein product [Calypogeia fissa]